MDRLTARLWADQDRRNGDRELLFQALATCVGARRVLYPGSFVDVSASMAFDDVTYIDSDTRAKRFFDDVDGVAEILGGPRPRPTLRFIHADYESKMALNDAAFDLLISLYAGFISEHCTRYLKVGGTLLVNPSHGDAAMASIDERLRLVAAVEHRSGSYHLIDSSLDAYFVPKTPQEITVDRLHELGRGIGYTKTPFAYLFERVS